MVTNPRSFIRASSLLKEENKQSPLWTLPFSTAVRQIVASSYRRYQNWPTYWGFLWSTNVIAGFKIWKVPFTCTTSGMVWITINTTKRLIRGHPPCREEARRTRWPEHLVSICPFCVIACNFPFLIYLHWIISQPGWPSESRGWTGPEETTTRWAGFKWAGRYGTLANPLFTRATAKAGRWKL